jgi:hypothetical protein
MRYTGDQKKEERQQALAQAKGWWSKVQTSLVPKEKPEERG